MNGLDGCGKSRRTGTRFPDRPAHSESLYRLSYPGARTRRSAVVGRVCNTAEMRCVFEVTCVKRV